MAILPNCHRHIVGHFVTGHGTDRANGGYGMNVEKPFGLSGDFTFEIDSETFEGIESFEIEPSHEYTSGELLSVADGISGTIEGTFEGSVELMKLVEDLSTYPMKPTLKRYFKKIRVGTVFFK